MNPASMILASLALAASTAQPTPVQSVRQLVAVDQVRSGQTFHVRGLIRASQHGAYIMDEACPALCKDVLGINVDEAVLGGKAFRDFDSGIDKARRSDKALLVVLNVSLNFTHVPLREKDPRRVTNERYRVSSVNVERVLSQKLVTVKRPRIP